MRRSAEGINKLIVVFLPAGWMNGWMEEKEGGGKKRKNGEGPGMNV
jgi:hypothetical protein